MPTPRIPTGFKPAAQGYSIGTPQGVRMSEVAGGMPRAGLHWARGWQPFAVTMIVEADKFGVWSLWFHRVIANGSIQFLMPINSGQGLQDHLCIMVEGSYSAVPVSGGKVWSVSFTVVAENPVYAMTDEEVQEILDFWEAHQLQGDDLLARIAQFATVDTLVLAP